MIRTLPSLALNTIPSALLALTLGLSQFALAETSQSSAENFIDAFYSFEAARLAASMQAPEDEAAVLYYQAWAKAADYQVQTRRPCTLTNTTYICRITVTDNFSKTLGYTATDTFTLTSGEGGQISGVQFSGDDPPVFNTLFGWIGEHQPEVMTGPCHLLFAGGTTPGACAKAVVAAAKTFMAQPSQ